MNDDAINDLKQFIAATVSQQSSDITSRLDRVEQNTSDITLRLDRVEQNTSDITSRLDRVEQKIDELSQSVVEALESTNESTDVQFKEQEQRITKLEQGTA